MKVVFVWDFLKNNYIEWFKKEDSMQDTIRELSQICDTRLFTLSNNRQSFECYDKNIRYRFHPNIRDLIGSLKEFNPTTICLNGFNAPINKIICDKFPGIKKTLYHHGSGFEDSNLAEMDVVFIHHQCQKKYVKHNNVHIVPHAPNINAFYPIRKQRLYDVIYPANNSSNKRVSLARKVVDRLGCRSLFPGVDFRVSGSKMNRLYNQSRCLLFVSKREAGPRTIVEAMACNLPVVVCSDCEGAVDYVKRYGGYIASPTIEDIVEKVGLAVDNKCSTRHKIIGDNLTSEYYTNYMIRIIKELNYAK